jgi:hypothetical protein
MFAVLCYFVKIDASKFNGYDEKGMAIYFKLMLFKYLSSNNLTQEREYTLMMKWIKNKR